MRPAKRHQGRRAAERQHLTLERLTSRRLLNGTTEWLPSGIDDDSVGPPHDSAPFDALFTALDIYADAYIVDVNNHLGLGDDTANGHSETTLCSNPAETDHEHSGADHDGESGGGDAGDSQLPAYLQSEYILYLDFEGGTVESRPGDFWLGSSSIEIPAFDLGSFGWAGRESEAIEHILGFVAEDYAPYNVTVTLTEPSAGAYTTIYVGGDNNWFSQGSSVIGVASYDVGNTDPSNFGFIFTEELSIYHRYSNDDLVEFSEYMANVVTHEAGHTFGANHISDSTAIMNPYLPINPRTSMFGSGTIPGGGSVQDTQQLLGDNLGYVDSADDYGDGHSSASAVGANSVVSGLLERRDDIDAFSFRADISGSVTLDIDTADYSNLDSLLSVYTNSGATLVAQNDDADGNDSELAFEAVAGQTYTIMVSSWAENSSGTYSLSLVADATAPRIAGSDDLGSTNDYMLDFGDLLVGNEATGHITVTNDGSADLVISNITVTGEFEIDQSGGITIVAGGAETVSVTFDPGAAGSFAGTVTIYSNDISTPTLEFDLAGLALAPQPDMALSSDEDTIADSWHLGNTVRGQTHTETLTITNTGDAPLTISDIAVAAPFTIEGGFVGDPIVIAPNGSSYVIVSVSGSVRGELSGELVISSSDPEDPVLEIDLATQVVAGVLAVHEDVGSPNDNEIDFGDVYVGESVVRTVTLSNTGDGPLTISTIGIDGNFAMESLATLPGSSDIVLQPGISATVNIVYAPEAAEVVQGSLTIVSDDTLAAVDLFATGHADPLTIAEMDGINDGRFDAGRIELGTQTAFGAWELTNNTGVSLTVSLELLGGVDLELAEDEPIILAAGESTIVSIELNTDYAYTITDTLTLTAAGAGTTTAQLNVSVDAYAVVGQGESYTFTTTSGDQVSVSLSGSAQAEVSIAGPDQTTIESIELLNATGSETLKISGRGAAVQLGGITGTGTLKGLRADDVDLVGSGIDLDGGIGRLRIADVLNGADIRLTAAEPMSMALGQITGDTSIDIDGILQRFQADDFADGALKCDALVSLGIANDLNADVTVTNGDLGKLSVRNGDINGDIEVQGDIDRITAKLGAITGRIASDGIGRITARDLNNADIVALSRIDRIDAQNDVVDTLISVGCDETAGSSGASSHSESSAYLSLLRVRGTFAGSTVAVGVAADETGSFIDGGPAGVSGAIGSIDLAKVEADNGNNPFGLVARDSIDQLRINHTKVAEGHHQQGDFIATVLGA